MKDLYFEKQRFRQRWLWFVLLLLNAIFIYGFVQQTYFDTPFGTRPASNAVLGAIMGGILVLTFFFFNMRMETRITTEGIFVRFFPLQLSPERIYWEDVTSCYIREYRAVKEYGGWGRRGIRHDRALNVQGNYGIQIVFTNGDRLLIGTQRPNDVEQVLIGLGKLKNEASV